MPFARPDLLILVNRARDDLFSRLAADDPLRRSDAEAYARVIAGSAHELYGYLDWLARQLMPDTAETEHLERWASIWGIVRKAAAKAGGTVTFTGLPGSVIPAGSVLAALDAVQYATVSEATITDTTVIADVLAVVAGRAGNRASGQTLTLVSPIPGVQSATLASAMAGGADIESDALLLERLLFRIRNPPMGGAARDYVIWATEVPGVTRVWVSPHQPSPGQVTLRFVRDEDISNSQPQYAPQDCESDCEYPIYAEDWQTEYWKIPNAYNLSLVEAHVNPLRPVTATLNVQAPIIQSIEIVLNGNADATAKAIVEDALLAVFRHDISPGTTLALENLEEAVEEGGSNIHIISPVADIPAISPGHLHFLGTITWLNL